MSHAHRLIVLLLATLLPAAAALAGDQPAQALELMNIGHPEAGVYTSGEISADDIARLQSAGVRHVIDLARDSETPDFDEASAVRAAGIGYDNLSIAGADDLTREHVEAFDRLLSAADRPVLVHCASGNRAGAMAALRAAWIDGKPAEEAIAEGRAWGLRALEDAVRARLAAD